MCKPHAECINVALAVEGEVAMNGVFSGDWCDCYTPKVHIWYICLHTTFEVPCLCGGSKGCYLSIWTLSIGGDVNIRRYQFGVSSWNIELSRILCRAFAHLLASAQLHLIWTCSITHLAYWVQCAFTTPSSLSDCLVRPAITIFRAHSIKDVQNK